MKIYIDSEYHCHTSNPDGALREIKDDFFNNKCASFVEGYCYDDRSGHVRIYPWKPYSELDAAQREYERKKLADAENALAIMWGGVTV